MFEGRDPDQLVTEAVLRFRAVVWTVLKRHSRLVTEGISLDGVGCERQAFSLSHPCALGNCDVFWSHSWHDAGILKWNAMQRWCDEFAANNGRQARVWLDKVCIDQTDLKRDLQCLPIFLAGCDRLVITCGPTYATRLWCCVELVVYTHMIQHQQDRQAPVVLSLFENEWQTLLSWRQFDAAGCQCFDANDKARMLEHIGRHPGGVGGFNQSVRRLLGSLQTEVLTPKMAAMTSHHGEGSGLTLVTI
jgi:hypothetical protein